MANALTELLYPGHDALIRKRYSDEHVVRRHREVCLKCGKVVLLYNDDRLCKYCHDRNAVYGRRAMSIPTPA